MGSQRLCDRQRRAPDHAVVQLVWTDQPDYEGFRRQADTELAAGVLHVNSAGNGGGNPDRPVPYNISTPSNCPPPWTHPDQTLVGGVSSTLAVGNIDWSTDLIAPSSSLGPSAWEDIRANTDPGYPFPMAPEYQDYPYENGAQMGLIKPDLAAYGNGTGTTCPGASYCGFSGTSSAAPHVSGTLALMLSSNPEATPAELAEAIMTTTEHRGDPGKNNLYGTGLVQAVPAVQAVESGVWYESHAIDDNAAGNGDLDLDPGEVVSMSIDVRSVQDVAVDGLVALLSTTTPGITIHNGYATYPSVPARGTATSDGPALSLSVDPATCAAIVVFDLELRFDGKVRRSPFAVRVGSVEPFPLLVDDFESDLGWTSDPGIHHDRGLGARGSDRCAGWTGTAEQSRGRHLRSRVDLLGHGERRAQRPQGRGQQRRRRRIGDSALASVRFAQHPVALAVVRSLVLRQQSGRRFVQGRVVDRRGANWILLEHLVNSLRRVGNPRPPICWRWRLRPTTCD